MDPSVTAVPVKVATSPVQVPSISLSASPVHATPSLMTTSSAHVHQRLSLILRMGLCYSSRWWYSFNYFDRILPNQWYSPQCLDLGKSEVYFILSVFFPYIRGCFAPYLLAIGLLILILSDLILQDQLVTLGSVMLL